MLFIDALKTQDRTALIGLLDPDAVFQIHDKHRIYHGFIADSSVNWIFDCLLEKEIKMLDSDHCSACLSGIQVVLFNSGSFPHRPKGA